MILEGSIAVVEGKAKVEIVKKACFLSHFLHINGRFVFEWVPREINRSLQFFSYTKLKKLHVSLLTLTFPSLVSISPQPNRP